MGRAEAGGFVKAAWKSTMSASESDSASSSEPDSVSESVSKVEDEAEELASLSLLEDESSSICVSWPRSMSTSAMGIPGGSVPW